MNPDMQGWYEVKSFECFACSALEFQREQARNRPQPMAHKEFVIDTRPPDDVPPEWVLDLSPKD